MLVSVQDLLAVAPSPTDILTHNPEVGPALQVGETDLHSFSGPLSPQQTKNKSACRQMAVDAVLQLEAMQPLLSSMLFGVAQK